MLQGVRPHMIFLMGFRRGTHGGGDKERISTHTRYQLRNVEAETNHTLERCIRILQCVRKEEGIGGDTHGNSLTCKRERDHVGKAT